jgi:hypothetical protein
MQPHSIRIKLYDQPIDAFDVRWVSRRTQQLEVALNPFVYFYARLAHALMLGFALGLAGAITLYSAESVHRSLPIGGKL